MDISLVISTWNNARLLRRTLESCCALEDPGPGVAWELVLVNNNCTDETDTVAAEFKARLPLVYVHEPTPGLSHGRNAGLAAAKGELIVLTDDDVVPVKDWLCQVWEAYRRHEQPAFFGGPIESDFEGKKPPARFLEISPPSVAGLRWPGGERELGGNEYLISANWACPRVAFEQHGNFDTARGLNPSSKHVQVGEETDLMQRLRDAGYRAVYLPTAVIHHFVPKAKTSLEHIGQRIAATAMETGHIDWTRRREQVPGIRRRLWVDAWRCRAKWWVGRLIGRPAYGSFERLCWIRGRLRGIEEAKAAERSGG